MNQVEARLERDVCGGGVGRESVVRNANAADRTAAAFAAARGDIDVPVTILARSQQDYVRTR